MRVVIKWHFIQFLVFHSSNKRPYLIKALNLMIADFLDFADFVAENCSFDKVGGA